MLSNTLFRVSQSLIALVLALALPWSSNAFSPSRIVPSTSFGPLFYADEHNNDFTTLSPDEQRRQWIDRSVEYYAKVMRQSEIPSQNTYHLALAKKHYFALTKIRDGRWDHAEIIYRRILGQLWEAASPKNNGHLEQRTEDCPNARLAVTTLLLALHLQRSDSVKKTRAVFLSFYRMVVQDQPEETCTCSAKVLQAFALFEMKQGNSLKAYQIVLKAVQLDPNLKPVLKWKQFKEAAARHQRQQKQEHP